MRYHAAAPHDPAAAATQRSTIPMEVSLMTRPTRKLLLVPALALLAAAVVVPVARAHDAAAPTASSAGVKSEILMWIKDAEEKLIELAEATPEAKYAWRPGKDKTVRSTAEVFMHVASANYGLPQFWGMKTPEGIKLGAMADFEAYEKSVTTKADVIKAMKESFAHMEQGLAGLSDADFERPAEFFGMKTTVRGGYMLLVSHNHEHLGQSIAYARSNDITPPWTARQTAAAAKAAEAKKAATGGSK
jgi:hypothetical protein